MPPAGPAFYARVYHPAFNIDKEDVADAADLFENHTRAVGESVQSLRSIFSKVREARIGALRPPVEFECENLIESIQCQRCRRQNVFSLTRYCH